MRRVIIGVIGLLACISSDLFAEPPEYQGHASTGLPNIAAPTLGGKQFWTDLVHFHDWRIQQHAYTGHCRLLDNYNVRRAWGDLAQCKQALGEHRRQLGMPPMKGKAVVLLHGLCATRFSMEGLAKHLNRQGYQTFNVTYASTRRSVDDHARALASVLAHLEGVEEINFVAHSLGNLVIRRYFALASDPASGRWPDRRIRRMVMLSPPNNGSELATTFRGNPLMNLVAGTPAIELAENWQNLKGKLATPTCEFGIIAGDTGRRQGFGNPLVSQADDLVVSVAETRLPGARDFLVTPTDHLLVVADVNVRSAVLNFIQHGYFIADDERTPILADAPNRAGRPR